MPCQHDAIAAYLPPCCRCYIVAAMLLLPRYDFSCRCPPHMLADDAADYLPPSSRYATHDDVTLTMPLDTPAPCRATLTLIQILIMLLLLRYAGAIFYASYARRCRDSRARRYVTPRRHRRRAVTLCQEVTPSSSSCVTYASYERARYVVTERYDMMAAIAALMLSKSRRALIR